MDYTIEEEKMTLMNFLNNEQKYLIDFISDFKIIGLTIASIIGLAVASISKVFTNEIIMPVIQSVFNINWKNIRLNIGSANLGVGLFLSELINLSLIVFIMFICYSLFKIYLSNIILNRNSWKQVLIETQQKTLNELKNIKKELILSNKKKQNEI